MEVGNVTTNEEVLLFANVLESLSPVTLDNIDFTEFTYLWNTNVLELIGLDKVVKELYTFKAPEVLPSFASQMSKHIKNFLETRRLSKKDDDVQYMP